MEKKITKRERYAQLLAIEAVAENADLVAFINHEVELLDSKNSKKSETKTQKENVGIMNEIEIALSEMDRPVTISELQANSSVMAGYSNQKLSALLKKMKEAERVVRTDEKGKAYFSVA